MTRIIKARDVKPGMKIKVTYAGWEAEAVIAHAAPSLVCRHHTDLTADYRGDVGNSERVKVIRDDTDVTVLTEPQPEEPTAFGACVRVDGVNYVRFQRADTGLYPWASGDRTSSALSHSWDLIIARGQVEVVTPDPFAPEAQMNATTETPVVPDRIEEWPANNEHLRGHRWRDRDGDVWFFDDTLTSGGPCWLLAVSDIRRGAPFAWPIGGPWERVIDV